MPFLQNSEFFKAAFAEEFKGESWYNMRMLMRREFGA